MREEGQRIEKLMGKRRVTNLNNGATTGIENIQASDFGDIITCGTVRGCRTFSKRNRNFHSSQNVFSSTCRSRKEKKKKTRYREKKRYKWI